MDCKVVLWIAKKKCNIELLGTYADNTFRPELATSVTYYEHYQKFMPMSQVKILRLWDKINLLHKEKKQVHGSVLTIIGIEVDTNTLTLSMPPDSLKDLIMAITDFITNRRRFLLKEWQCLAGWMNWSFNVFPLL